MEIVLQATEENEAFHAHIDILTEQISLWSQFEVKVYFEKSMLKMVRLCTNLFHYNHFNGRAE